MDVFSYTFTIMKTYCLKRLDFSRNVLLEVRLVLLDWCTSLRMCRLPLYSHLRRPAYFLVDIIIKNDILFLLICFEMITLRMLYSQLRIEASLSVQLHLAKLNSKSILSLFVADYSPQRKLYMNKSIMAIKSGDTDKFAVARAELISLLFQALVVRNRLKIQATTMAAELRRVPSKCH